MLKGKRALVTGATGGLGLAIARKLAQAGCSVMLHGIESEADFAEFLRNEPWPAGYCRADLTEEAAPAMLVERTNAVLGGIDILVNNAVVRHFAPIEQFDPQRWNAALAVNVSAAFHAARLTIPGMRAAGWGRIINMSSIYGARAVANRVDYITTKAALFGLTRAISIETVRDGITCNAVCPGSVLTPASEQRIQNEMTRTATPRPEAERNFLTGKQPSGRFVEADDVASLIVFLCSPAARDITGAILPVDGGWLAS